MKKILVYASGFLLISLIWYLAFLFFISRIIPNPICVYRAIILSFHEKMHIHIIISLGRIIAGISISLILGGLIGYTVASNYSLNKFLNPLRYFTSPITKTSLLPVIIIIGLADASKITLIMLIVVFQILVSVLDSIQAIERECIDYILSLGASKKQVFYHVIFPKIIPGIIRSIRATLGTVLSLLFFCEGFGTSCGIGYYIWHAWSRTDYISMYNGIIFICILAVLLYLFIDLIEKKMVKWK
jgi:NitT/TauT family transport system permease protein